MIFKNDLIVNFFIFNRLRIFKKNKKITLEQKKIF